MIKTQHNIVNEYFEGILKGNITELSKAITLIESKKKEHQILSQELIEKCLPYSGKSRRIGITGIPGVGKSTFIEVLGKKICEKGNKLAVLAIDPSSEISKGSILGDKTRMQKLSTYKNAFIRPTPASGSLGGVARKTYESIILCEAAGYDTIFIETVGVGQSETTIRTMVDFFLLLTIYNSGDELQGIKRGIMEMADLILVNKADGDNIIKAKVYRQQLINSLHFYHSKIPGWNTKVEICSANTAMNINKVLDIIDIYFNITKENEYFYKNRLAQKEQILVYAIKQKLSNDFFENKQIKNKIEKIKIKLQNGSMSLYNAVNELFD